MRERKDKLTSRHRATSVWVAGGGMLLSAAVFLASCSMTAEGKEGRVTPEGSMTTRETAASGREVRIGNRAQRYPVTEEIPKGAQKNWITLSLLEVAGKSDGLPKPDGKKPKTCYIKKQTNSKGGFSSAACSYDVPADWVFGSRSGEPCLEVVWPEGSEADVCLHITENRLFPDGVGDTWKEMQKQIRESAGKTENIKFSDFRFERYLRADERELLFYSFVCSAGEERVQYAVAYVTGERFLAEFIGSCPLETVGGETVCDYAIEEITRYMAASYEETKGEKNFEQLKYRPYLGHENWAWDDLHNPFALAADLYAPVTDLPLKGADREITFVSKEWEELLRIATGSYKDMSDQEFEEFIDRPLRASDLAWIREVTMTESPIPGRDTVSVGGLVPKDPVCADYNLTTLQDIAVLPNLQQLTLEIGSATDYEVLKNCPSLQELTIVSAKPLAEPEWLCELPDLTSLTLRISMFSRLNEMGYEKEGGSTFGKDGGKADTAAPAWGDLLPRCKSLQYLDLEQAGLTDFGFLDSLPDLYTFRLSGEESDSGAAKRRQAAFSEGVYPQIKCLVVDDAWLRNPA